MAGRSPSDPTLAEAAVEESLRYEPITPFTARILIEDVVYRDVTFPEGTIVMVCAFTGNRDLDAGEEAADGNGSTAAAGNGWSRGPGIPASRSSWRAIVGGRIDRAGTGSPIAAIIAAPSASCSAPGLAWSAASPAALPKWPVATVSRRP